MRARAREIEIPIARVLGAGAKTQDVEETVAETEDGALVEVEDLFPARGRVDDFVCDVGSEIGTRACFDG